MHRLSAVATAWMDTLWDPGPRLLRDPPGRTHLVRETSWYAVGLLARGGSGDAGRAVAAIAAVLDHQYDAPGTAFHGSWRRTPEEPDPGPDAAEWRDYDPNWREFIGCTLLLVLREFAASLPPDLIRRIDRALALAAGGARARAVSPSYTNIALMGAYLFDAVGHRHRIPGLRRAGAELARRVYEQWARTSAFPEFNSPTYYGVDLFALALWRSAAPSAVLRRLGAQLEHGLWQEIATRYHPGLRNLAGPFDRAYGMDMRRYAALLGLWIGLGVEPGRAPLPAGPATSAHAHDWCFAPCFALLGAPTPPAGPPSLPRLVTTTIEPAPRRVATTWLGPHHTIGAQDAATTRNDADEQYCPVAVHWAAPRSGDVNWLRVAPMTLVDARVDQAGSLHLTHHGTGGLCFEAYAPHADPRAIAADHWRLPGLTVRLSPADGLDAAVSRAGDLLRIAYRPGTPARLSLQVAGRSP